MSIKQSSWLYSAKNKMFIEKPSTVQEFLKWGKQELNSRREAEILLEFILNVSRSYLYTWPDRMLSEEDFARYKNKVERRKQGEPIPYIVGEKEFWSLTLKVSKDVLIPRPETELLVEEVLKQLPCKKELKILELGTGSGAIALALAKECPLFRIVATDISFDALEIAKENAKLLGVNSIQWLQGNWFDALKRTSNLDSNIHLNSNSNLDSSSDLIEEKFNIIISNPPYIAENDEHLKQGDLRFEPRQALVSKNSGLKDLTHIIQNAHLFLEKDGWLLLEHGWDQAEAVKKIFQESKHYCDIQNRKDLSNITRVTMGKLI